MAGMSQSASFCQTEDRCPLRSSAGVRARKLLGLRYEVEALGLSQGKLFLPLQQALECLRQVSHCHQGAREEISAHLKIEFVPKKFQGLDLSIVFKSLKPAKFVDLMVTDLCV